MAPELWERIKEVFDSALDVAPAERGSYLDRVCAGDAKLKSEVGRLLLAHDHAGDFLAHPVVEPAFSLAHGDLVAGRYLIKRLIGRGGMGEVYEARDQLLNEAIALKTLRVDLTRDEGVVRRFLKEIQLARKVTHPNVCRVFEAGVHEVAGGPPIRFFTMELLGGETLAARARRAPRLTRAEAFPIAVQMAEGLQAAHEMGIVHADFKSGNVLLIPALGGDRAVITDFGLARIDPNAAAPEETRTMNPVGQIVGTVAYMSPEQMTGGNITTASDIYSFGIVLFEMATGQLPFDGKHLIHAAVQRVSGGVTARSLVHDIDPRWDAAIARCLQKDPARRFASAEDLADSFREGVWRMPRLYWTRRDWIRAGFATGIPMVSGSAFWIWSHRPYQPKPAALDWFDKGIDALHSMTFDAARKAFEQAVAADPKFALAHASLARAYDELDYTERAKESMLRALAEDSRLSSADDKKLRALQFVVSRDYDRAAPLLKQLEDTADAREKPAAALEVGWLAQQREKPDLAAATAAYQRALKADPGYAAAKLRLGFILGRRGDVEGALKTFREAEGLYSASSDYEGVTQTLLEQATLLSRVRRAKEAMPVIEKALSVATATGNNYQQVRLQLLQGTAYRNLGEAGRAGELALRAIAAAKSQNMDNLATSGLIDLGTSFLARGELEAAERHFVQALELARRVRRNEARAQFQLGSLFEETKPAEATKFLEAALPFYQQGGYQRELTTTKAALGGAYVHQAEFDEGTRILGEALASATQLQDRYNEAGAQDRLADALYFRGDWPKALLESERLVSVRGSGFRRLNCARLYWRLGRQTDSAKCFSEVEQLLEKSSSRQLRFELRINQAEFAYQYGRLDQAMAFVRQARSAAVGGGEGAERRAKLLEALVQIRTRHEGEGSQSVEKAIAEFERSKLVLEAASARLAAAEALVAAGQYGPALKMAREALDFFESRRIWEAVWRGHQFAARASQGSTGVEDHRLAAQSALAQLKTSWPPESVNSYLRRPDIRQLSTGLEF